MGARNAGQAFCVESAVKKETMSELEVRFLRATMLVDTVFDTCNKLERKVFDMPVECTADEKRTLLAAHEVRLRNTIQDVDKIIASFNQTAEAVPPDYEHSFRFVIAQFRKQRERLIPMQLRVAAQQTQLPPPAEAPSVIRLSIHVSRNS